MYLIFQKCGKICLGRGNGRNAVMLDKIIQYVRRKKRRERRAETDVLNAKMQLRQQNAHGLWLIPTEHHGKWQIICAAAKRVRQRQCNLNGTVGVVALASVKQTRISG